MKMTKMGPACDDCVSAGYHGQCGHHPPHSDPAWYSADGDPEGYGDPGPYRGPDPWTTDLECDCILGNPTVKRLGGAVLGMPVHDSEGFVERQLGLTLPSLGPGAHRDAQAILERSRCHGCGTLHCQTDHIVADPVTLGVNWYEQFDQKEADSVTIPAGSLVLVEVHGLPDNDVKAFTYRTTEVVQVGHQVNVPAPEWSVKVTGREQLPGFVLGSADMVNTSDYHVRDILPGPAHSVTIETIKMLVDQWEKDANHLEEEGDHYSRVSDKHYEAASKIRDQVTQLRNAAGI